MASTYFLDTSALFPRLLKRSVGHAWVNDICDPGNHNLIVIAEITEAEIASTLNQLVRGGTLQRKRCDEALALFWSQIDNFEYVIVPLASTTVRRAADLCSVRALRGMDTLQLACALWARDDLRLAASGAMTGGAAFGDPIFHTEDNKLRDAAIAEGFVFDTPINHAGGG